MKKMLKKPKLVRRSSSVHSIFNAKIVPIERYKIKGDQKELKEFQKAFLNRIMSKYKMYHSNYVKKNTLFNNSHIFEHNSNKSIIADNDKNEESIEYLYNIYIEAATNDSTNLNTNIFISEHPERILKIDDNNPYVYSLKFCHPFSMLYQTKYKDLIKKDGLSLPSPRFINSKQWMKEPDLSYKAIFSYAKIVDQKGVVTVDPETLKKYDGLVSNVIGQILRIPFGHHISIPIKIFEPATIHQRYIGAFSYANKFLIPASDPNLDPYERFKLCITFAVSGLYVPISPLKPFNPFLGETFQGELPNGAKIYIEQVTHSPFCARYYVIYKKIYEISGYWNLGVKTLKFGTQLSAFQKGPLYIKFPQINECIIGHYPKITLINVYSDDRANLYDGNMVFIDIKNHYKAVLKINENPKCFHEIIGSILKYNYGKNYKYDYEKEWEFGKSFEIGKENRGGNLLIDKISGSWLSKLIIGNNLMWDINAQLPEFIRPVKNCIPSDGRFREDIIWLYRSIYCSKNEEEKKKFLDIAQEWKVLMEEFNRWERRRRAEIKKKNKIK